MLFEYLWQIEVQSPHPHSYDIGFIQEVLIIFFGFIIIIIIIWVP